MGNVCCGGKEEQSKSDTAFSFVEKGSHDVDSRTGSSHIIHQVEPDVDALRGTVITTTVSHNDALRQRQDYNSTTVTSATGSAANSSDNTIDGNNPMKEASEEQEEEQRRRQQEELEDLKCQRIVQSTGRAMVSVSHSNMSRRDRNTIYYSDQGFAAALAQHLEHKMKNAPSTAAAPHTVSNNTASFMWLPPIPNELLDSKESSVEVRTRRLHDLLSQPLATDPPFRFPPETMNRPTNNSASTNTIVTTTSMTTANDEETLTPPPLSSSTTGSNNNITTTTTRSSNSNSNSSTHQQQQQQRQALCEHIVLDHIIRPAEQLLDAKCVPPLMENLL